MIYLFSVLLVSKNNLSLAFNTFPLEGYCLITLFPFPIITTSIFKSFKYAKSVIFLFIKDGKVFHQLYKGNLSEAEMYQKISDAMTAITAGGEIDE